MYLKNVQSLKLAVLWLVSRTDTQRKSNLVHFIIKSW